MKTTIYAIILIVIMIVFAIIGYKFDKSDPKENELKVKINNYGNDISKLLMCFSFVLFFACSIYVVLYIIDQKDTKSLTDDITKLAEVKPQEELSDGERIKLPSTDTNTEVDFNGNLDITSDREKEIIKKDYLEINFKELLLQNGDVVGWLKVNNTNINYPFVQTDNNDYYLNHNLNKKWSSHGWIFMDFRNNTSLINKNTIIYGHNTNDGQIFGTLKYALTDEWLQKEENHIIQVVTLEKNYYYNIFSVYEIPEEIYYITTDFSKENFGEFIDVIKDRSLYDFNVEVDDGDYVLTLSTCSKTSGYRNVVHAKLIYSY